MGGTEVPDERPGKATLVEIHYPFLMFAALIGSMVVGAWIANLYR
jgi:hypothetical protein